MSISVKLAGRHSQHVENQSRNHCNSERSKCSEEEAQHLELGDKNPKVEIHHDQEFTFTTILFFFFGSLFAKIK